VCWPAVRRACNAAPAQRVEGSDPVAFLSERRAVKAILQHLGLPTTVRRWRHRAAVRRWSSFPGQTSQTTPRVPINAANAVIVLGVRAATVGVSRGRGRSDNRRSVNYVAYFSWLDRLPRSCSTAPFTAVVRPSLGAVRVRLLQLGAGG
jgi:hypothetical protein